MILAGVEAEKNGRSVIIPNYPRSNLSISLIVTAGFEELCSIHLMSLHCRKHFICLFIYPRHLSTTSFFASFKEISPFKYLTIGTTKWQSFVIRELGYFFIPILISFKRSSPMAILTLFSILAERSIFFGNLSPTK